MTQQKPPPIDSKNMIMAVVLSMLIVFGWQYFYLVPQQKKAQELAATQQTQTQSQTTSAAVPGATAAALVTRDAALKQTSRLTIDTPELSGSINLTGAQIDDLHLKNYKEEAKAGSPTITLLSPSGVANAYFAEQGLVAPQGSTTKVPDAKSVWSAPAGAVLGAGKPVTLSWDNGAGLVFTRDVSIDDGYVFTVKQSVENKTQAAVSLQPYARIQRQDTPKVAGWYVFFEGMLGVQNGALTEAHYSKVAEAEGKIENESTSGWLGFTDKYWATALIPSPAKPVISTYQHFKLGERDVYQTDYLAKDALVIQPGTTAPYEDHLFAGPKVVDTIKAVGDKYKLDKFDLMNDWGWFWPLTKPMFRLLQLVQGLVGNFGLAILLVTVLVKLAVFPIANKSYASMSKMKKLQPQMEEIKKQFPDDRMKQQQATMELYKKEKVSPLAGCLPVVIQIPVFFSLYKVILTNIELRHAPFFGWINDLSSPDPTHLFNLFGLLPFNPPAFLAIGVWPILMGITMWVQMRLNPAPADPIQASMFNWMPVIFTFTLGSFPAGLVIYWSWSNLLSIIQQAYIMKKNGVDVNLFGNIRESIPFLKKKVTT
jgi:YidC/Oxa1 family membrane protein insertase